MSEFLALSISFLTVCVKAVSDVPAILAQFFAFLLSSASVVTGVVALFPTMVSAVMYIIIFLGILGVVGRLIFGGFGKK